MISLGISRRKLLIGSSLIIVAGISEGYVPRRREESMTTPRFEALFPRKLGAWQYFESAGFVLPPQDQLSKDLYEQLLTRVYADTLNTEIPPMMMVLAYSSVQEGRLQVHRPEVCYPAAGFTIVQNDPLEIRLSDGKSVSCRFLVAQRGARQECILYWTRVGDAIPTRWFDQRLQMAKDNLRGWIPDGLLARLSVLSPDPEEAAKILVGFFKIMVDTVGKPGRRMLIGDR